MPAPRPVLARTIVVAALALAAAGLSVAPALGYRAERPTKRQLYHDGPDGRYLLGGSWLFRLDREDRGLARRFYRARSASGWSAAKVPGAWNVGDYSNESMVGSVGWYRKDFRLPSRSRGLAWLVRFESVNYRARVWLNGREIGSHTGAYLPFELPLTGLRRGRVNRLVIRVDSRRHPTDFPPSGFTDTGFPLGGWWNYGGLLREVYLRRVDRVDMPLVQVRPLLRCPTCSARIDVRVTLRNRSGRAQRTSARGRYGRIRFGLGAVTLRPGASATLSRRVRVSRPQLWSPADPHLYAVTLDASIGGHRVARQRLHSGIRSIRVSRGRLLLNGRPTAFRGVGVHEDDPRLGAAMDTAGRQRMVGWAKQLGATVLRSHYPLHPYVQELADRLGLLVWSEIPVYSLKTEFLRQRSVRRLAADELRQNILANQNHPSVFVWSVANELTARPTSIEANYFRRATRIAHRVDPTRPVGLAIVGYPAAGCQSAYRPFDLIGVNEYFGWYTGPSGQTADRDLLSPYLDSLRGCYPRQAIAVSEFGAEANRAGPAEERGTWAFQQDFVNFHLGVFASKPWLSGAIYWTLQEYRVRPGWSGGNPRPSPPLHQKGLVTLAGERKPAFFDVQRSFRATRQYGR